MNEEISAVIGLALFELRLKALVPRMDEETERACTEAICARMEALSTWVAKNPPVVAAAGMVSAAAVIDALARRALRAEGMQFIRDKSPLFWYLGYCLNVVELSEVAQDAVKDKSLTLRKAPTRVPLRDTDVGYWLEADLGRRYADMALFPECAGWDAMHSYWPDALLFPPGAVIEADADAWAVSSGIAGPGELRSLLGLVGQKRADDRPQLGGAVVQFPVSAVAALNDFANMRTARLADTGAPWTPEMRLLLAGEEASRKAAGQRRVRAGLARDLKITVSRVGALIRKSRSDKKPVSSSRGASGV